MLIIYVERDFRTTIATLFFGPRNPDGPVYLDMSSPPFHRWESQVAIDPANLMATDQSQLGASPRSTTTTALSDHLGLETWRLDFIGW